MKLRTTCILCMLLLVVGPQRLMAQAAGDNDAQAVKLNNRGVAVANDGRYDEAIALFNQALALNRDSDITYRNRGSVYHKMGQHDKALADFNKLIGLDPLNARNYNSRGLVHIDKLQLGEAAADFAKAVELNPDFTAARENLKFLREELGVPLPSSRPPLRLTVRAGEIRLDGRIREINPEQNSLVLDVTAFTLPSGKTSALAQSKPKVIKLNAQSELLNRAEGGQKMALADLQANTPAVVIGKDVGSGQEMMARQVVVGNAAPAGEVGTGASGARSTLQPPRLPDNFVGRPRFALKDGRTWSAGTAFGARLPDGKKLLLSALHLFGEAAGLKADIPAKDIPDLLQSVQLYDMRGAKPIGDAGKALLREGFPLGAKEKDFTGDLVAFELPQDSPIETLPLAPKTPAFGAPVWIAGKVLEEAGTEPQLYSGTVMLSNATRLIVRMDPPVSATAFSGAPALNASGEIVGMMLGANGPYFLLNPVVVALKTQITP